MITHGRSFLESPLLRGSVGGCLCELGTHNHHHRRGLAASSLSMTLCIAGDPSFHTYLRFQSNSDDGAIPSRLASFAGLSGASGLRGRFDQRLWSYTLGTSNRKCYQEHRRVLQAITPVPYEQNSGRNSGREQVHRHFAVMTLCPVHVCWVEERISVMQLSGR